MKYGIIVLMLTLAVSACHRDNFRIHHQQVYQNFQDSILFQGINKYYDYLDSGPSDDVNYAVYIKVYRSRDTVSFLINCNESHDIYSIINSKYVYRILNHNVFSEDKIFSFESDVSIDSALKSMNEDDYKYYIEDGTTTGPPVMWDCKFLYLVICNHTVIRNELRFYDGSNMFKNDF
ncbi:MAG TPA: hypothetical protein VK179_18120 [Bacteroidales bacterium]|nr:hypothetical protein [Bacteroidales bacterium]